ncbi:MAG: hypothetical protein K2L34_08465, partial [Muribaculaceae bacterium]|nr:hypothetical protein [Muribaculaceae bacterium]
FLGAIFALLLIFAPVLAFAQAPQKGVSLATGQVAQKGAALTPGQVAQQIAGSATGQVAQKAALTPEQVAQKAAAVITDAKGITATFTISANGRSSKGTIKSSGNKFSVLLPEVSSWYNGKDLYVYNQRTSETTVTVPTAQELLESNPLLYVKGGAGGYSYSFSPVKRTGKYVVDLVPRSKKTGIKKLTFTINATNFQTERIAVSVGGGLTTIDVTSFKTGGALGSSEFEYPRSQYPKVEVIDLR